MQSNVAGRQGRGQHNALQGKAGLGKAAAQRAPLAPQLKGYALEDVPAERPAPQRPAPQRPAPAAHSTAPAAAAAAPAAAAAALAPRHKLQPAPQAGEVHREPRRVSAVAPAGPAPPRAPAAADAREAAAPAGRSSGARRERDKRRSKQKLAAARGEVEPAGLPGKAGAEGPARGGAALGSRARGAPLGRPPAERTEEGARLLAVRGVQQLSHDKLRAAPPRPPASSQPGADECVRRTGDGGGQPSDEAPADVLAAVLASRRRDAALGDAAAERDASPARAAAEGPARQREQALRLQARARPSGDGDAQARGARQRDACIVPAMSPSCEG